MPTNKPTTDTTADPITAMVLANAEATARLVAELRAVQDRDAEDVYVVYSYMFCEVCERNYRELLVRFDDGSIFSLCPPCGLDLRNVVEIFGITCSIQRF